jgi:hypothetical protein
MRKLFLIIIATILAYSATNSQTLLQESFGSTVPSGWKNDTTKYYNSTRAYDFVTSNASNPAVSAAKGGAYFAKYNCWSINAGNQAGLRTKAIDFSSRGSRDVKVSFWMFRDNLYQTTYYDSMTVWVNTTQYLSGATKLGAINRHYLNAPAESTPNQWYQYTYTIPSSFNGTANYIIFNAESAYGPDICMDEVEVFIPADMSVTSTTTLGPPTNSISAGSSNNQILQAQINTTGTLNLLSASQLVFNTNGTSNTANITSAKLYYTGTSGTFSTATLIGTINNPSGAMTFNFTQELATGANNFWLAYDVASTAPAGSTFKAEFSQATVASVNYTPSPKLTCEVRKIGSALSGTYTIGNCGNYSNLSSAIADLNTYGATGNVNFNVISNTTEPTSVTINRFNSIGGTWSLNIAPVGGPWTVSGDVAGTAAGLIRINGAINVNIDGGVSKNLVFKNTNGSGSAGFYLINSGTNYPTDISIKNTRIQTGTTVNNTFYGIFMTTSTGAQRITIDNNEITGSGAMYSASYLIYNSSSSITDLKITNNSFKKSGYGIYLSGGTLTNLNISSNLIGVYSDSSQSVGYKGLYLSSTISNGGIFSNKFEGIVNNTAVSIAAMEISSSTSNTNFNIYNNQIRKVSTYSSSGYGAYGLNILGGTMNVYNNIIQDVTGINYSVSTTYNALGLRITGGTGIYVYNNVVDMNGTTNNVGSSTTMSAALCVTGGTSLDIRNNIFNNTTQFNTTGSYSYAMYITAATSAFSYLDYNLYFASSNYLSALAYMGGVRASLSEVMAATTKDANSQALSPVFKSRSGMDYHLDGSSATENKLLCPTISPAILDMDGESRGSSTLMGLDHVNPTVAFSQNLTISPNLPVYCNNSTNVTFSFTPTVTGFADGVSRSNINPQFSTVWYRKGAVYNGPIGNSFNLIPAVQNDSADYYAVASLLGKTLTTITRNLKVETPIAIISNPISSDICSTVPTLTLTTLTSGTVIGYQWQKENSANPGTFTNILNETKNTLVLSSASGPAAAGRYRCLVYGTGNCGASLLTSNVSTVNIADPLANFSASVNAQDPNYICSGSDLTFTAQATGTITGYQWQKWTGTAWDVISLNDFPTAQSSQLVITNATTINSTKYRCLISGSPFCSPLQVTTNEVNVVIWPLYQIISQPASQQLCANSDIILFTSGNGKTYSYQWQKDGIDIPVSVNPSAQLQTLIIKNSTYEMSGDYTCRLVIEDCRGIKPILTDKAAIYVQRGTEVTVEPEDGFAKLGSQIDLNFHFDAHVTGSGNSSPVKIAWFKEKNNKVTPLVEGTKYSGTNSNLFTITKVEADDYTYSYFATVSGKCGGDTTRRVTIMEPTTLTITKQASDVSSCAGTTVSFTVEAASSVANAPISYQWYYKGLKLFDNAKYSGTTTSTLKLTDIFKTDIGAYTASVKLFDTLSAMSNPVNLDVKDLTVITGDLAGTLDATVGKPIDLEVTATGTNLSYEWYKDNTKLANTTSKFSIASAALTDGGVYYVIVKSDCGDVKSKEITVAVTQAGISSVKEENDFMFISNVSPNPVHDNATIEFGLKSSAKVRITLSNLLGEEIAVLIDKNLESGVSTLNFSASDLKLTSSTYFITMQVDSNIVSKQVVVVR